MCIKPRRCLTNVKKKMASLCNLARCVKLGIGLLALVFYCEFVIYYVTLLRCSWPQLSSKHRDVVENTARGNQPLKIMVLADTHLLGYAKGHWLDKLRREWQMHRSFQSTMLMHNPDLIFVLGDLLDEGKWAPDSEFDEHVARFKRLFKHPSDTSMEVVVGNHDIGFHYSANDHKLHRFEQGFGTKSVKLLSVKDNLFIMLNSMAMEGDDCSLCRKAKKDLKKISRILGCSKKNSKEKNCTADETLPYTRPVLLQHFPLYRESDAHCDTFDQAPPEEKFIKFREKWECLSKSATKDLLGMIEPRLVLSGHTHHGCYTVHRTPRGYTVPEWSVASYSWRNKKQPTFLLMVLSNSDYAIAQCSMPHENTVYLLYLVGLPLILLWFVLPLCCRSGMGIRKAH